MAVALGLVGIVGSGLIIGSEGAMAIGATTIWDSVTNYTLTMLPLFVLMGNVAANCGLSSKLYQSMSVLIGHRRGGLALATIGASAGFGMISGSSLATTATAGPITIAVLLYCLAIWVPIWMGWSSAPQRARANRQERRAAWSELLPPVGIFGIIMGGLYSGVFTANETAAIGPPLFWPTGSCPAA